ncbi:MAG: transcription elongation factor Spt5 [Thermoplasmata archaeon]|nr:MAG: transcription elongation factor Spt5 [Thermoplasmata archaeon]RLF58334.1 MAG: transcription elongation factor Spt5 [Thermoplasmata archaeon]
MGEEELFEKPKIFSIKTQIGKEQNVAELIRGRIRKTHDKNVLSVLVTPELRGYVFIEAYKADEVKKMIRTISYVRGMLDGNIPIEEIEKFLTPASSVEKITEGDIVEMISGPFKGEMAKVTHIDTAKEEITVELLDSVVPIPITVKGDQVRVVRRKEEE